MAISTDKDGIPTNKPAVQLSGGDGNVFAVLGLCRRAALRNGWTQAQWALVREKMTAGEYDDALATAQKYFEVS